MYYSYVVKSLLTLALCSLVAQAQAQISQSEREVLINFYLAAGGDNWYRNDGWLDDDVEVCAWYGIDCQFR